MVSRGLMQGRPGDHLVVSTFERGKPNVEPIKPYYSCPSCGGELVWNEKEAVYVCRFCRMAYTSQRLQPAEPPAPHKEGRQPVWQGSELWESSRIPSPGFEDACAHTIGDTVGAAPFSAPAELLEAWRYRGAGAGVPSLLGCKVGAQGNIQRCGAAPPPERWDARLL